MQQPQKQQGVALVVGLSILLIMTIIGLSAVQMTTLDEKMAGNFYDRNIAFQAAEAALNRANFVYDAFNTKGKINDILYVSDADDCYIRSEDSSNTNKCFPHIYDDAAWTASDVKKIYGYTDKTISDETLKDAEAIPLLSASPVYLISKSNVGEYFAMARAQGRSDGAVVILQKRLAKP